jgi:hypothetical protein
VVKLAGVSEERNASVVTVMKLVKLITDAGRSDFLRNVGTFNHCRCRDPKINRHLIKTVVKKLKTYLTLKLL